MKGIYPTTTASILAAALVALVLLLAVQGKPQAAVTYEIGGIRG